MSTPSNSMAKEKPSTRILSKLDGRVLVVDDEAANRLYLRKLLETRGCVVLEASCGQDALKVAYSQQPDLILVDVVMPGMNGFECCDKLKGESRTADIPIIMVTAKTNIEDIETGFELGAMDYIRKPFNPRELLLRVGNALALKKSNDALTIWNNRVSRDLELAGAIQRSLFSDVPHFSDCFEVRIAYRTCMDVGGDAFDIINLPNGKHCVYVADVSGHGVAPAMISALLKASASEMALKYAEQGPAEMCNGLNAMIRRRINNPSYFATMFMAVHDPEMQEWRCMNCGHPNPVFVRNGALGNSSIFNEGGGAPLGFPFGNERPYSKEDEVSFKDEGDTFLLLYTDGLTEAMKVDTREDCSERVANVYEEVVNDSDVSNKAVELINVLESEKYMLGEDDCTAISIHLLDPRKKVLEKWISRDIQEVSDLSKEAEMRLGSFGISGDAAAQLRLLLMELGANLVDHSGLQEHEQFWVQVRVDRGVCQLVIIDEGDEWDLEEALERGKDSECMSDRGRGLAISHSIADRIERFRVNTENMTFCTIVDKWGEV